MKLHEYILYNQLEHSFREGTRTIFGAFLPSIAFLYLLFDNRKFWKYIITSITWSVGYLLIVFYGVPGYELSILAVTIGFAGSAILFSAEKFTQYLALNLIPTITLIVYLTYNEHRMGFIIIAISLLAYVFIFLSAYRFSTSLKRAYTSLYRFKQSKKKVLKFFAKERTLLEEIKDSKLHLLEDLGRAEEYRDEEIGNHIFRVGYSCYLLAKEFGFSENRSVELQQASRLHDLGKIGISDDILLNPVQLTDEEFKIMQKHTQIGFDILGESKNDLIQLSKTIAISHHEKWDGSGYPNGLKDKTIPIEGRIVAVCDVFDALTSERPYKKAWSNEDAIQLITEQAGQHFDPDLVLLFLKVVRKIIAYHEHK